MTDGGVTAYRWDHDHVYVVFTDNPSDSPSATAGPLGAGFLTGTTCTPFHGNAGISGFACSGNSGDPVSTYTCDFTPSPVASTTAWCLFSENPRTVDGKAWAVKYVNGEIPTNDGASIVRCEGTDLFDPVNGCAPTKRTLISVKEGYIKLDTIVGSAPPDADCSDTAHYGRMIVDEAGDRLYICTQSGWTSKSLTPAP